MDHMSNILTCLGLPEGLVSVLPDLEHWWDQHQSLEASENREQHIRAIVLQADTVGSKRSEKVWEVLEPPAGMLDEGLPLQEAST